MRLRNCPDDRGAGVAAPAERSPFNKACAAGAYFLTGPRPPGSLRELGAWIAHATGLRHSIGMRENAQIIRRRDLLSLIGAMAGSSAMYHAMTSLGFAAESRYAGPIRLEAIPKARPS